MDSCRPLNVNITRSSTEAYLDYKRRMQNRLANLNNNVSNMIKESFSGIDDICQRVRECLHTSNLNDGKKSVSFVEELSEYEIVEERSKSADDTPPDNDETSDASVIEKLDQEDNRHLEEAPRSETIVDTNPIPTPYITVISCNDKGDSNEPCKKPSVEEIHLPLTEVESMAQGRYGMLEKFKETVLSNIVTTSYDDFDVMNKIIENINAEIKDFSEAAISGPLESNDEINQKAIIKRPILNPRLKRPPPIRRPSTSPAKQKYTKIDQQFSENELDYLLFTRKPDDPFVIPDVYRKRAFTDLYERLMAQLEANDSLVFFQKLMNRHRHKNKTTQKSFCNPKSKLLDIPIMNYYPKKSKSIPSSQESSRKTELGKKYKDSLWFSHFKGKSAFKRTVATRRNMRKTATGSRRNISTPINYSMKSAVSQKKSKTKRPGSGSRRSSKVNSMSSISDKPCSVECTCKMVVHNERPLAPSAKCRLHWMRAKTSLAPTRKLQFLDILDDLTNRDLLPLQSEYPRRDNQSYDLEQNKDIQSTYLYKLMYGKQGTRNVWKQLLEPTIECSQKNCNVCKPGSKPSSPEKPTNDHKEKYSTRKYSKHEILKKLSPYMRDPERREKYYQSVTVMPVHVHYDSYKSAESPTKLSSSRNTGNSPKKSLAFKEIKGSKRAEWSPSGNTKLMKVVYDSLPKKIEVPPLALHPNRPSANSARFVADQNTLKSSNSKSFSPKSFAPFCDDPNQQQLKTPIRVELKELKKFAKIQSDIERIKNETPVKILNDAEKKLWATKYQKTVGQQLVSFVERQEHMAPPAVPKYAAPKYKGLLPDSKALSPTKDLNHHKHVLFNLEGLKQKNSAIQNNIQKAITVIEAKMVDILSADGEGNNVEAFDAMEKEITDVLSFMKGNKKKGSNATSSKSKINKDGVNTEISLEEEVSTISDELFKKLEKILDSERSSAHSTRSGGTDISVQCKPAPKKNDNRSPPKKDANRQPPKKEETKLTAKLEANKKQRPASCRKSNWDSNIQSPLPKSPVPDGNNSVDIYTPTKLNAPSSPNKADKKPPEKAGRKSKLSTITSARTATQSTINAWDDAATSAMPCGDQNTKTVKKQGVTNKESSTARSDPNGDTQDSRVRDSAILEKSQGDGGVRKSDGDQDPERDASDTSEKSTDDEKQSKKVRFEEFLNEDRGRTEYAMATSEDASSLLETAKDEVASTYYTPNESPTSSPKLNQNAHAESSTSFAEQVNKIIKRVEDIYTQLDDMHNSSSEENITKFKDDIPKVHSEMFLTPFMQAVKEKRKTPEKAGVQKSPSYYNVINFLDSLKEIQDEKPIEMHTARLCYHVNVYHQPMVYNQAQIEHTAEYLPILPAKPSCIKKIDEDQKNKGKKVHFLAPKENKSNQATVCNFHRNKVLKISSQQFPSMKDEVTEDVLEPGTPTEADRGAEISLNIEREQKDSETEVIHISCDNEEKGTPAEIPKFDDLSIADEVQASNYEVKEINFEECTENLDTTAPNENPVEVYCHVADEPLNENTETSHPNETNRAADETDTCEKQNNLNVSKLDKPSQSINQMHDNNTDANIKAVNTDTVYNERGINTDEMDASQSTQNCSHDTSLASLLYDGSREVICPKVVKQQIDIRDSNYRDSPILNVPNSLQKLKQNKIVVFREVKEVPQLLKSVKTLNLPTKLHKRKLEKRKGLGLMSRPSGDLIKNACKDVQSWGENVVLLKSFYAIVYILMFTALSMDYRCM